MDRKKEIGRDNGIDLGEVEIVRFWTSNTIR
jgi:hypothetical protein